MLQKYSSTIKSVALGKYPYTYARVSVMRSFLLKKSDYQKISKMSLPEIMNYLGSSQYKEEMDEFGVKFSGAELAEIALNANLSRTFRKIRKISPSPLGYLIDIYLIRKDFENIKTILRGKFTNAKEENIMPLLQPYKMSLETLKTLVRDKSILDILISSKLLKNSDAKSAFEKFNETKSLAEVENALDFQYLSYLSEALSSLPNKGSKFRQFLALEMEISNLLNILRFKREGLDKKDLRKFATEGLNRKLANSSMDEMPSILGKSKFGDVLKVALENYSKSGSMIWIETALNKYLYDSALTLLRQRPLLSDSIIGYIFAKEIEVKNLKMVAKAKQLAMSQQFIEENLVI